MKNKSDFQIRQNV